MSLAQPTREAIMLPKKLPIAIFSYNHWYTGRVKNCFGNGTIHVTFDRMDDSTKCVPTQDMTVDHTAIVQTSALTFPCPYAECDKHQPGNHFQDKSRWQQHIRMHNGTAPRCPFCRAMDANLRRHIRRHGREGPVRPLIVATDAQIAKMKIGVLRATLEAAGVPFKGLKGEDQLRHRLRTHKVDYKRHVVAGMLAVASEIAPQYQTQQDALEKYLNKVLEDDDQTIGSVMLSILRQNSMHSHSHVLNEKSLLKRLQKQMLAMLPEPVAEPVKANQYLKAIRVDTTGDGVADGFKIDTNNDGTHDTFVRVVGPPEDGSGRWARTLKKRRLGTMKSEQLDVSAVLQLKDNELHTKDQIIANLRQQLENQALSPQRMALSLSPVPGQCPSPIDVACPSNQMLAQLSPNNSLPPQVEYLPPAIHSAPARIGAIPPELEPPTPCSTRSAGSFNSTPAAVTLSQLAALARPPSPRWRVLQAAELYDSNLIRMLKSQGFTDSKYWGCVTSRMLEEWERTSGIPIKPGVKIKFLDVYGKKWRDGTTVEVLNHALWQTGEVVMNEEDKVTVMCKTCFTEAEVVVVPRTEVEFRVREPTFVTKIQTRYEDEIERLKGKLGESNSTASGTESESPVSFGSRLPEDGDNVKEEPIDEEFNWHSLKNHKPMKQVGFTRSSPEFFWDVPPPCMEPINTEAPWDTDQVIDDSSPRVAALPGMLSGMPAGRLSGTSFFQSSRLSLHATPLAIRGALPEIPKFRAPAVVRTSLNNGSSMTPMEIPEPLCDFAG